MIVLNKQTHTYYDTETNDKYTSVSKSISKFVPKFDPDGHILRRTAQARGTTTDVIKKEWDTKRDLSIDRGVFLHKALESYIQQGDTDKTTSLVDEFRKLQIRGVLEAEKILWDTKSKIAGTADLVQQYGGKYNIWDLKSNEDFTYESKYKNRLLVPFTHLEDCKYTVYSLQLSFYAWLLEKCVPGAQIGKLTILWYTNGVLVQIPVIYMKYEIIKLLHQVKNK